MLCLRLHVLVAGATFNLHTHIATAGCADSVQGVIAREAGHARELP